MNHEQKDQQTAGKSNCQTKNIDNYIGLVPENIP
jgi:hypothetical protein